MRAIHRRVLRLESRIVLVPFAPRVTQIVFRSADRGQRAYCTRMPEVNGSRFEMLSYYGMELKDVPPSSDAAAFLNWVDTVPIDGKARDYPGMTAVAQ